MYPNAVAIAVTSGFCDSDGYHSTHHLRGNVETRIGIGNFFISDEFPNLQPVFERILFHHGFFVPRQHAAVAINRLIGIVFHVVEVGVMLRSPHDQFVLFLLILDDFALRGGLIVDFCSHGSQPFRLFKAQHRRHGIVFLRHRTEARIAVHSRRQHRHHTPLAAVNLVESHDRVVRRHVIRGKHAVQSQRLVPHRLIIAGIPGFLLAGSQIGVDSTVSRVALVVGSEGIAGMVVVEELFGGGDEGKRARGVAENDGERRNGLASGRLVVVDVVDGERSGGRKGILWKD